MAYFPTTKELFTRNDWDCDLFRADVVCAGFNTVQLQR